MTMPDFALGEYDTEETDAMLDELVEADGEEFTERRPGRSRGRTPNRRPGVAEAQRNAQGIKAINDRINTLDRRVDQTVRAIAHDRAALRRLEKLGKLDGVLDLADGFTFDSTAGNLRIDFLPVIKGLLKSGFLGEPKGALGNPALVAGAGFVAKNPGIISGIFNRG